MRRLALASLAVSALLNGCATTSPTGAQRDPIYLLERACEPGTSLKAVKGSVWLKAQSKDASGQFPASVDARAPAELKLEVTNMVGGTEAVIDVRENRYTITVPGRKGGQKGSIEKGEGSWGGIPLHWATDLFLGRVPCPSPAARATAKLSVSDEGELTVDVPAALERDAETFIFRFHAFDSRPWPESLRWERRGTVQRSVDFKFSDPDQRERSPGKWEAKSSQGEVKVRWRERELMPSGA